MTNSKFILLIVFLIFFVSRPCFATDKTDKPINESDRNLEKAWACEPGVNPKSDEIYFINKQCISPNIPEEESIKLLNLLKNYYPKTSRNGRFFASDELTDRIEERCIKYLNSLPLTTNKDVIYQYSCPTYDSDNLDKAKRQIYEKIENYTLLEIENSKAQRAAKLKKGELKIQNYDDAVLFYGASVAVGSIMKNPLLKPDNKIYIGREIRIDDQISDREFIGGYHFCCIYGERLDEIAVFKINKNTKKINSNYLRIGSEIKVVGKYIGNKKSQEFNKIIPVIELLYLEL